MIFLDIDGVLRIDIVDHRDKLRSDLVNNVRELAKVANQKIVLSSAWRYGDMGKGARLHQSFCEADGEDVYDLIVDRTPRAFEVPGLRGIQIHSWIEDNDYTDPIVIIDDSNDMVMYMDKLVHVDPTKGFIKEYVKEALDVLQKH